MSSTTSSSTGFFNSGSYIDNLGTGGFQYITKGSLVKFVPPAGYHFNKDNQVVAGSASLATDKTYIYATVTATQPTATPPSATVSQFIPSTAVVESIIPAFKNDWTSSLISTISSQILANKNFGLRYDIPTMTWELITSANLDTASSFSLDNAGGSADASWFLLFEFAAGQYTITQRNLYYYAESVMETRFYFDPKTKVYDSSTGMTLKDHVKILKTNSQPDSDQPLGADQSWYIYDAIIQSDGYQDTKKILVTFPDSNNDGIPDDPTLFETLIAPTVNSSSKYVFFKQRVDYSSFTTYDVVESNTIVSDYATKSAVNSAAASGAFTNGTVFYAYTDNTFYVLNNLAITESTDYVARTGRQDLYFQYRHNSPNNRRIDPSPNNIMDLYMLTKDYNTAYFAWVRDTSNKVTKPVVPTTEELRTNFGSLENLKALSDTIIYNSVKFKPLFGAKADPALQATFKIVKNPNITISDNEVKSQVITAINTYFEITNWDFGESFYFSELSAYLHNKLTPNVSSIIIVPSAASYSFGSLYQINAEPNEIITSAATVDNIEIISAITASQLNLTAAGLNIV
jgi:hypothetical protein